ncbi:spinster family MFS transporter [Phenylobacterium sp. VNQ135]|uniref:spinster family MFS transporter n=1 Tax=Phenylobacterium sp. VNQ135 TaxID=3400922 RepID=UPI003C028463
MTIAPPIAPDAPPTPAIPLVSERFRRYALLILMLTYTVNYLDRQIVTILAEPIKNELKITDTQLGLLTGFAFGIVYVGLGLPLARLADRMNRVWIITGSLVVWSGFTALCGRAVSFPTLVAARMGVGVGEAGCAPTCHALIADYTPREKRASALAIFQMGGPIGGLFGLALGGVIADVFGWRTAFLLAGLPGLLLAVVVFFTLKEPRDAMAAEAAQAARATRMTFRATLTYLMRKRTFWLMSFAASIKAFIGYGHAPFTAAFLLRVHGDEVATLASNFGLKPVGFIGISLGLLSGVFGATASYAGGVIADRFGGRDLRAYASVPAIASLATVPFFTIAMTADSLVVALLFLIPNYVLGALSHGPVFASAQGLVPPQMRATCASIVLFIINMMGLGLGALAVGALSDLFNFGLGLGKAEGVRWALIVSAYFGLISAALFWLARKYIREEMVS